jgi:3-methyladenine DNA glycosylase AlkD
MSSIKRVLNSCANKERAKLLQGFFKTGKGQYGEGDVFLGIVVPKLRKISKEFWKTTSLLEIQKLLDSKIHEERLLALFMLVEKYKLAKKNIKIDERKKMFEFYLANTSNINNWDLVDLSAPNIVGDYLLEKDRRVLYKLVKSDNLWERRISILSTFAFIREKDFEDSLKIADILLLDKHDLIHKAVGWMLREIGKRDVEVLRGFLKGRYKKMPRTMLRYAIEKFDEKERKKWLKGER